MILFFEKLTSDSRRYAENKSVRENSNFNGDSMINLTNTLTGKKEQLRSDKSAKILELSQEHYAETP